MEGRLLAFTEGSSLAMQGTLWGKVFHSIFLPSFPVEFQLFISQEENKFK